MSRSEEKVVYPRKVAIRVITRVLSDHMLLDEALNQVVGEVPPPLWGWLQDICSGTLRWKGRLDGIIDSVASKKKPSGGLRKALLLASYQIIAQDRIHPGVVVSETVADIRAKEGEAPAKFANACLRRIAEHASDWRTQKLPEGQTPQEEASWASLPEWLWTKLVHQHGREWAEKFAQASLERPTLWVRSRRADWNAAWVEPGPLPCSWKSIEGGAVTEKAGFSDGEFIVQDISSQTLIHEVSKLIQTERGSRAISALDVCAAPGGKAIGLAWNQINVTATEKLEKRVPLLAQSIARAAPEIQILKWSELDQSESKDLVWVDAPCSGIGILRRHPDVRWLRQEKELHGLVQAQQELVRMAWGKVNPQGYMVYSVCSVLKEEGPGLIKKAELSGAQVVKEWFLSPHDSPFGDGFWAVLLRK